MNNSINDTLAKRELETTAQAIKFFGDWWAKIVIFFTSYRWREVIFMARIVSIVISLIFLALIIMLLIRINVKARIRSSAWQLKESAVFNRGKIAKKWSKIEKNLDTGIETNYKLAVLEADKIFSNIVENLGPEAEIKITNMEKIREIDKVKNSIVEDSNFTLSETDARKIIGSYQKALQDLKIL